MKYAPGISQSRWVIGMWIVPGMWTLSAPHACKSLLDSLHVPLPISSLSHSQQPLTQTASSTLKCRWLPIALCALLMTVTHILKMFVPSCSLSEH